MGWNLIPCPKSNPSGCLVYENLRIISAMVLGPIRIVDFKTLLLVALLFLQGIVASFQCIADEPKSDFKIGAILGLTGHAQAWGKYAQMGARLAVDEQNTAGGLGGRKISIVIEDSKSDPKSGVLAFKKLQSIDHPDVIFGDVWSYLTEPLIPLAAAAKIPLIAPTVVPWTISAPGDFFFTMGPKPELASQAVGRFFELNPNIKSVSIFCADNSWGAAYLKLWKKEIDKRKLKVLNEICVSDLNYDFRTDATKVAISNPDAVIIAHGTESIIKLLRERNFSPPILTTSNVLEVYHNGALSRELSAGVYFTEWFPTEDFERRFEKEYGIKPMLEAHNSYEVMRTIFKAYQADKNLKTGFTKVKYHGVTGAIDFTSSFAGNDSVAKLYQFRGEQIVQGGQTF